MSLDTQIADLASAIGTEVKNKQDKLESNINIKTINGESVLGSGNITIAGGSGTQNVFIQETEPTVTVDSLWIQRLPNGNITMWLKGL